jgi:UV excision repair protein RAD23
VVGPPFAGPAFEESVSSLKEMGFPESEVRTALKAAFGNTERAADFLMSGAVPEAALAAADAAIARGGRPGGSTSGSSSSGGGAIAALRSHPQINDMRRLVQDDPSNLAGLLASIGRQNPDLLRAIQANQDEFVALLNEPIDDGECHPPAACRAWRLGVGVRGGGGARGGVSMHRLVNRAEGGDVDMGGEEDGGEDGGDGGGGMPGQLHMMAAMLATMTPEQRAGMAAEMGIPLEQLNMVSQRTAGRGGGGDERFRKWPPPPHPHLPPRAHRSRRWARRPVRAAPPLACRLA